MLRTTICGPEDEVLALRTDKGWMTPDGDLEAYCPRVEYQFDDDPPATCSMLEFIDANGELYDAELFDVLTGGTIVLGGGAAPLVRVTGLRS